ncbi:MAG: A24 family peptidase [Treponema sp.]|jgi:Flp pilus assembly protein protease CpaA|nr:A24 family peptidase [Treponema sp.]
MYAIAIVCFCLGIAIFDLKTYRIPDALLISFVIVIMIIKENGPHIPDTARFISALTALLIFGAVFYFSKGMGMGDVKYASALGYILGPDRLVHAFLYTALLGILIYLIGILLYHWPKTTKIQFAPFLSAGVILALELFGNFSF